MIYTYGNKTKQAIVFIHGFILDHTMWKNQYKELSKEYCCIGYDVRGLGKSDAGDGQYTMEQFVDDLEDVVKEAGISKPFLCGLSMGGYIALRAAERNPSAYSGIILCDTRATADNKDALLKRAAAIKMINNNKLDVYARGLMESFFHTKFKHENPDEYKRFIAEATSANPVGVKGCLLAMMGRTSTKDFAESTDLPLLGLTGEFDSITPPSELRQMMNNSRNGQFEMIPDAGHIAPSENPVLVNNLIHKFISRILR